MNNRTKKLCILSGNFRTWMIDVLPQIVKTTKEPTVISSKMTHKITINFKIAFLDGLLMLTLINPLKITLF